LNGRFSGLCRVGAISTAAAYSAQLTPKEWCTALLGLVLDSLAVLLTLAAARTFELFGNTWRLEPNRDKAKRDTGDKEHCYYPCRPLQRIRQRRMSAAMVGASYQQCRSLGY
jgi:hypothetical protein